MSEIRTDYLIRSGVMSDRDIIDAMEKHHILISKYNKKNLTPLGYNFTPTRFVFSIKKRTIEKVHYDDGLEYAYIRPNDTVLVLSRESIFVSDKIMGTFHSKVGMVSLGFGHISTTLDPLWEGPLLFAINNPTGKRIKLKISKINKDTNIREHISFTTVIFQSLINSSEVRHDNPTARINILKSHIKGKHFAYRDLKKFCETIDSLNQAPHPLVADVFKDYYKGNKDITKSNPKQFFDNKYNNYLNKVNDTIDSIMKINKWIVVLNFLRKYWWIIILYLCCIYAAITTLPSLPIPEEKKSFEISVLALSAVISITGIVVGKGYDERH